MLRWKAVGLYLNKTEGYPSFILEEEEITIISQILSKMQNMMHTLIHGRNYLYIILMQKDSCKKESRRFGEYEMNYCQQLKHSRTI